MKEHFLLDPDITFLNHGSFGATPRPVFAEYQRWQRELERQPVHFMEYELAQGLKRVRGRLGEFLGVSADTLLLIPNATFGINLFARSCDLQLGDEILTTNHEYGACESALATAAARQGATLVHADITLPTTTDEAIIEQFFAKLSPRTKVVYLSHITSFTALTFPIKQICERARELGLTTIIDGAHAPNQIPLNLAELGADFYTGNLHKWVSAPKGSAFFYAREELQSQIKPLIVSWDWTGNPLFDSGSPYLNRVQWSGTNDPAAYFAVPAALDFLAQHDWPTVRERCHQLVKDWVVFMEDLTGLPRMYGQESHYHQMAIAPLPPQPDLRAFKDHLNREFKIEIPCLEWNGWQFIRVSVQGYNDSADLAHLKSALTQLLS